MSTILGIDTASTRFAVAIAVDGDIVDAIEHDLEQDHTRALLVSIDRLLGERRNALDGIVVVRGPGSYAGLRVGIATAEGLAIARNAPLAGAGTLEAVASLVGGDGTAIQPAGRGEYAAQRYHDGEPAGPLFAASPAELGDGPLAGEGAGSLGGREVAPVERVRAALLLGLPCLAAARAGGVDAIYLREPNITRPRRAPASAG